MLENLKKIEHQKSNCLFNILMYFLFRLFSMKIYMYVCVYKYKNK